MAAGCAVNRAEDAPRRESGLVTNTILNKTPPGIEPAWIYEIDGKPVNYLRRTFRLTVGEHTIKVWPNVEPGYRYYLGARTNITRTRSTIVGTETYSFPTGKFIYPVVTKEAEPADYVQGAKGMSLFFLSIAIPAAITSGL